MSVLIVDDDPLFCSALKRSLRERGLEATVVEDGQSCRDQLQRKEFDIVLLDWGLGNEDGLELLGEIKGRHPALPVIMLTAEARPAWTVSAFDRGVDDYMSKPFDVDVLVARMRRLVGHPRGEETIRVGLIEIVPGEMKVAVRGREVSLTRSEFKALLILAKNRGSVVTKEQLHVAMESDGSLDSIRGAVKRLRAKLGEAREQIRTERSKGFVLVAGAGGPG